MTEDTGFGNEMFGDEELQSKDGWCACMQDGDFGSSCPCVALECSCLGDHLSPPARVCLCEHCIVMRYVKTKKEQEHGEENQVGSEA